jgi:hypothetical protein
MGSWRVQFPEVVSGLAVSAFAIAIAALVSSQLMLMSVLDTERAGRAADQIATSRFVDDVVVQTVARAITPFAGPEIAGQLAVAASSDPRVEQTVRAALVDAHGQIVDPNAPAAPDGNALVNEAIVESVADAATAAGVDLQASDWPGRSSTGSISTPWPSGPVCRRWCPTTSPPSAWNAWPRPRGSSRCSWRS